MPKDEEKKTPRPKGEGAIYQRTSDGIWCASLELRSPDGSRRRKVVTAKTEAQVKVKLKELKKRLAIDGDIPTSGQTLETWMNYWYREIAVKKIRPRTAANYRSTIDNHIIPSLGKVRLDRLTPAHVRRLHSDMAAKLKDPKDPTKGTISSSTIHLAHRILAVSLKYAQREKRVTDNVANLTDAPRIARTELAVLTADHGVKVLRAVAGDSLASPIVLPDRLGSRWAAALLTGARQGELLGLELDRITTVLDMSWQLQRITWLHGCGDRCGKKLGTDCPDRHITAPSDWEHRQLAGGLRLARPKSKAGWRMIPLVEPLRTIIERRIDVAVTESNPHGLLWTSDPKMDKHGRVQPLDGSPIDPSRDNKAWHEILRRADVPDARLHDARHTTASLLLKAGVPEKVIMQILGHNSYVVTRKYQDVDLEQLNDAMTRLSAMLPLNQ
jgi:integrase